MLRKEGFLEEVQLKKEGFLEEMQKWSLWLHWEIESLKGKRQAGVWLESW